MPTLMTSMEKTVAVSGVPNNAEKPALMPHIIISLRSYSSSFSTLPSVPPMLPPSCSAAPSRPAEPPQACVSTVAAVISGAMRSGT